MLDCFAVTRSAMDGALMRWRGSIVTVRVGGVSLMISSGGWLSDAPYTRPPD